MIFIYFFVKIFQGSYPCKFLLEWGRKRDFYLLGFNDIIKNIIEKYD